MTTNQIKKGISLCFSLFLCTVFVFGNSIKNELASNNKTSFDKSERYFVDQSVHELNYLLEGTNIKSNKNYHVFSHGKPGQLWINDQWLTPIQIAEWLSKAAPKDVQQINIYGCNFAKGKKGKAALDYIESELGVPIAASNDITGQDGDWDLEVGNGEHAIQLHQHEGNLQGFIDCATIISDDDDYFMEVGDSKVKDGYTYVAVNTLIDGGTKSMPVINGEDFHPTTQYWGSDGYLAVFDPNCNQIFGSYIGGDMRDDIYSLTVDDNGNYFVTGKTESTDFPTTDGTSVASGTFASFIQKYTADGTLVFSTVFGETDNVFDYEIIVDGTDIYVVGENESINFPTTDGTTYQDGGGDGYLVKYDGSGNLVYSTLLGGTGHDRIYKIIVINGCAIMSGTTRSSDFPTTDGSVYSGGLDDAFLTKYDATGNLVFSTIYGGSNHDNQDLISMESDGNFIYISSRTRSPDFPTTDGSIFNGGSSDVYLRKYDLAGNLIYSQVFGGSSAEEPFGMQIVNGDIFISGYTTSPDFPVVNGVGHAGSSDVFLTKFDANGNIIFSTMYGGGSSDSFENFYVNAAGEAYLVVAAYDPLTTDGTSGRGMSFVKYNADGSLCIASLVNLNVTYQFYGCLEVQGDTLRTVLFSDIGDGKGISTDGSVDHAGYDIGVLKYVLCTPDPIITTDTLSFDEITVCENSLVDQIIGMPQFIDGSQFPQIYTNGIIGDQQDTELNYQWQVSASSSGPWTDIPGPLAQLQNYSPSPLTTSQYYQRLTKTSECCGGTIVSTSDVAAVLIGPEAAPTVDAGGTFYTCPGFAVTIGGSPAATGGTPPYLFDWENGTYSVENPTVTTSQNQVYTLLVTDANGCVQVDQATVSVYQADAGADASVCDGASTSIGGTPLQGIPVVPAGDTPPAGTYSIAYDWTPKDGSLDCTDCPNPAATPIVETDYTLSVTLYFPDGTTSCQTTDMVSVRVITGPPASLTIPDVVVCLGEVIELGTNPAPITSTTISAVSQTDESPTGWTGTPANLTDGDLNTGASTTNGNTDFIVIDLGQVETINNISLSSRPGDSNSSSNLWYSTDGLTYTMFYDIQYAQRQQLDISFPEISAQYIKLQSASNYANPSISEFSAFYDYVYTWSPGDYLTTNGSSATFDPGNIDMPVPNAITYTVSAVLGECAFYEQVTVAVIEARAGEDFCGPRVVGEPDRTPGIDEIYSWSIISDPAITTGSGSFLGAPDQDQVSVSASVGGDVGYELTTTYTLGGSMGICRDTVIVPEDCLTSCDIVVSPDGCPDFDEGSVGLLGIPPNNDDPANWTYSWTSNLGMDGLDSYNTQAVNLTDNITRTYTVTFTSILDPTYTCSYSMEVNSPSFTAPSINVTSPITVCKGDPVNIGDPANNPGFTYAWSSGSLLDDPTISYPEATVFSTTEFTVMVTSISSGCSILDTVLVMVPTAASAGPDLNVCDNGVVKIGANISSDLTYSWEPVGADWRNGSGPTDPTPEVFVATTQDFILTATDLSGTCVSIDTATVVVESLPPPLTLPDLDFCPGQATPLVLGVNSAGTNLVPAGYSYTWNPSSVSSSTIANPEVNTPLPTTPFTYELTISTPGGCSQKATQTLNPVISPPLVGGNQTICLGESIFIGDEANQTGPDISYSWDPATDLDDPTSINPEFTPTSVGTFTFTITKNNTTLACNSTAEVTILVKEVTPPSLVPQTICEGESVLIGPAGDPLLSYSWDPVTDLDDPFIANPTFTGTTSTNYTLIVIDGNGCTAEAYTSVTVNGSSSLTVDYPDIEVCSNETTSTIFEGSVLPVGSYSYNWSPASFLSSSNEANPTFLIPGNGSYEYVLEIIDQTNGCSLFDTLNINVAICGDAVIGNYIWLDENGDGVQDAGEPGIPGVVVELKDSAGNVIATTTTDANGGYIFTDLLPGDYTVTVLSGLPAGLEPTYDEDSGTAGPDQSTVVTVASGDEHMTADFSYNYNTSAETDTPSMADTGAIGDHIWNDADGDGVQDPGESGIAGVTVNLYTDPDGDGVYDTLAGTTTTDATGNYIFDGLPPAAYVVEVDDTTLPAGFTTTPTGDPDGDGDNTAEPIILAPGDVILTQDFGYNNPTTYTIGDTVFMDANGDGIVDANEPGISGVTVSLEDAAGNVIATTTTDANGNYSFPGIVDGTYTVVITDTDNVLGELDPISDPDGGLDNTSTITISGADDLDQDFGYAPDGHSPGDGLIGDMVYIDTDGDGAATDGEGVEGVTVNLYAADGTTLLATTTTDENGNYSFGGLDPTATYVVDVDETTLPGGDVYTNMEDPDAGTLGTSTVDLSAAIDGINLDQDFGYVATNPVSISGSLWEDTNADGTFDASETDIFAGVTVNLYDADGNVIATTVTDASGNYSFDNLPPGIYTVSVDDTDESLLGYWHSLGLDSEPSTTVVDASAGSVTDVDFGYYIEGASLGNFVWNDTNEDGIQDAGEPGIEGVLVTLEIDYDGDGVPEITVVDTTDASGHYDFGNLLLDEDYTSSGTVIYTISVTTPTGYVATTTDVNSNGNDLEDSDDPTGTVATVVQGANDVISNADPTLENPEASYDFGFNSTNTTDCLDDFNNTPYETPVVGDVTTNDWDKEGDTQVTFTEVSGIPAGEGSVVFNPDGTYTYTPPPLFSGETSFVYEVCDSGTPEACDTATVYIEVLEPLSTEETSVIANPDANSTEVGVTATGNILSNDIDPEFDPIEVTTPITNVVVSGLDEDGNIVPNAGTLTINPDGTYTFVPTGTFTGIVTHPYSIGNSNGTGDTDNSLLVIHVIDDQGNDTFANDDAEFTDKNVPVSNDVITNDFDPEDNTQTVTAFDSDSDGNGSTEIPGTIGTATTVGGNDPTGAYVANAGDLTLNADGTYTFVPAPEFVGNVIITYTICDGVNPEEACDEATLVITIQGTDRDYGDAPIAYPDAWHRLITDVDGDKVLDGATDVWLGMNTSFEAAQLNSTDATGDDYDDGITFGANPGQFPLSAVANTSYNIDILVNSSQPDTVYYGLWIDWDNDGVYEDFYSGSQATASPATVSETIMTPATVGTVVNIRLRGDDDEFVAGDYMGGKANGEVEDYQEEIILPIELVSFVGNAKSCVNHLEWATASETNNDYFEMQRSFDGVSFEPIAEIAAAGNSQNIQLYSYRDEIDSKGEVYYRLKQVDTDGSSSISHVVVLKSNCEDKKLMVFPNPTTNVLKVSVNIPSEEQGVLLITDMLGRALQEIPVTLEIGNNLFEINTSKLAEAHYFINLKGDNFYTKPVKFSVIR